MCNVQCAPGVPAGEAGGKVNPATVVVDEGASKEGGRHGELVVLSAERCPEIDAAVGLDTESIGIRTPARIARIEAAGVAVPDFDHVIGQRLAIPVDEAEAQLHWNAREARSNIGAHVVLVVARALSQIGAECDRAAAGGVEDLIVGERHGDQIGAPRSPRRSGSGRRRGGRLGCGRRRWCCGGGALVVGVDAVSPSDPHPAQTTPPSANSPNRWRACLR